MKARNITQNTTSSNVPGISVRIIPKAQVPLYNQKIIKAIFFLVETDAPNDQQMTSNATV